jgi:glycosyltransferase involved in cell wall biosynthesis
MGGQGKEKCCCSVNLTTRGMSDSRTSRIVGMIVISDLEYGGAQRQVVELCNNMDPSRFELHVVSLSDYVPLGDSLNNHKERLHILQKQNKWDLSVVFKLRKLIKRLGVRVVHAYLFDALIAARLAGGTLPGVVVIDSERNCLNTFKKRHLVAYAATKRFVDRIIANSSAGAKFNEEALGMDHEKYRVVHNGVETARFSPRDRAEAKRQIGIDPDDLVIGMFASFKPQKNHPILLEAMAEVAREFPAAQLILVGDELHGGMSDSVEFKSLVNSQIENLGLQERCHLLGNRDDVEAVYPACDITVLPSLYEGTPNVALESMACGVPVVATDVSDNQFVIPDGKAGFIVPVGDAETLAQKMMDLLRDQAARRSMGERARKWVVSEFSCARLAEKTADVYEEALREKSKSKDGAACHA